MADEYKDGQVAVNPDTGEAFVYNKAENKWVPQERHGPVMGALLALQNGLLLGYGDEAVAAGRAGMDLVMGRDGPGYRGHQRSVADADAIYAQEHPRVAGAANVTGASLPIVGSAIATGGASAPMLAPRALSTQAGTRMGTMLDATKVGALYGAAMETGQMTPEQRDSPLQTAGNMVVGAGKGGAMAATTTGGAMAVSAAAQRLREPAQRLWQYVRGQVPGTPPPGASQAPGGPLAGRGAQGRVLDAIEDAGTSPQAVRAAVGRGRAAGVPAMPIDHVGNPGQRVARGIRTIDPRAGNLIDTRLNARAEGQLPRVANQVEQGIGAPPVGPAALPAMAAERQRVTGPLYEAARQRGPITDPAVLANLQERASVYQPLHEASRRAQQRNRGTGVPPALYDDTGKLTRPPTADDIQMIKEGADRRLYNDKRGVSEPSNAMSPSDRRDLQMTFRASREGDEPGLLPLVDDALPEYAQARQSFAGHTALENALQEGLEVAGKSADDIAATIGQLASESERAAFRSGAVYGIRQALLKAQDRSEAANVLNSIFGWGQGSKREALRQLFPDDASFARFQASAEAELAAVKSRRFLQSGSNTADKLVDAADVVTSVGADVAGAAGGNPMSKANLVRRAVEAARGQGAGTRYEIADALTSTRGDEFLLALERMQQERLRRLTTNPAWRATAAGTATQQ